MPVMGGWYERRCSTTDYVRVRDKRSPVPKPVLRSPSSGYRNRHAQIRPRDGSGGHDHRFGSRVTLPLGETHPVFRVRWCAVARRSHGLRRSR